MGGAGGSISALCIACSDPLEDIQRLPVEAGSRDIQAVTTATPRAGESGIL